MLWYQSVRFHCCFCCWLYACCFMVCIIAWLTIMWLAKIDLFSRWPCYELNQIFGSIWQPVPMLSDFEIISVSIPYTMTEVLSPLFFATIVPSATHYMHCSRASARLKRSWATHIPDLSFGSASHSHLNVTFKHTRLVWNHGIAHSLSTFCHVRKHFQWVER